MVILRICDRTCHFVLNFFWAFDFVVFYLEDNNSRVDWREWISLGSFRMVVKKCSAVITQHYLFSIGFFVLLLFWWLKHVVSQDVGLWCTCKSNLISVSSRLHAVAQKDDVGDYRCIIHSSYRNPICVIAAATSTTWKVLRNEHEKVSGHCRTLIVIVFWLILSILTHWWRRHQIKITTWMCTLWRWYCGLTFSCFYWNFLWSFRQWSADKGWRVRSLIQYRVGM